MSESVNPPPLRHSSHYFSNIVVFLVENQLFRVPAHMFESTSPVFQDMFSLPPGPGQEVEGQADATPIRLDQVAVVDFERLLRFFYPMVLLFEFNMNMEEWGSILHLAKKWEMTDVSLRVIDKLDKLGIKQHPTLQIEYGRKYDHKLWIYEGFSTLITSIGSLTQEEGERLGLKDVIRCAQARDLYLRSRKANTTKSSGMDLNTILKQVFDDDVSICESDGWTDWTENIKRRPAYNGV